MWIGALFAGGSVCFAVGPFPGFVHLVGAPADAAVFFAGSLLFTAAATLQFVTASGPWRRDQWAGLIQLAGTVFFNVSTFEALREAAQADRLVWAPDVFGSVCFLVASALAWLSARGRIEGVNLAGSVAFGISAVAAFVVPGTGDVLALGAANFTTVLGALCFLVGALWLIADARRPPLLQSTLA